MVFLTNLLASIIRPIIQGELDKLKSWVGEKIETAVSRRDIYAKYDLEANELIKMAEQATTTEEVKSHVRRLKASRAKLNI